MKNLKVTQSIGGIALISALFLVFAAPVLAHEARDLGNYHVEVGFEVEPAIFGQMNAIAFFAETKDGKKVEGLEKTIKFEALAGGKTKAIEIQPVDGDPGHYTGAFIPTLVGDYTFHMTGKIEELQVDEKFESGPNRFDPVTSAQDVQFPNQLASTDQLTATIAVADAKASQAQTFAIIGIVAGVIGILAGGAGLLRRKL